MNREEKKAFEMLLKDGPEKTLGFLKNKMNENNSSMKKIEEDTKNIKGVISLIEGTKKLSVETPSKKTEKSERKPIKTRNGRKTMRNAIIDLFEYTVRSKSVKSVYNRLKSAGYKTTKKSVASMLYNLEQEGFLERPSRGRYKVASSQQEKPAKSVGKTSAFANNKKGIQKKVLNFIENREIDSSVKDIENYLDKEGLTESDKATTNVLYNLKKKGKIAKVSRGVYRSTKGMTPIKRKVVTISTVKKAFTTHEELTSKDLKSLLVDSGKMSYTQLHSRIKKLVDEKFITRIEKGKYRIIK